MAGYNGVKTPIILNGYGDYKETDFSFSSGTDILYACSVVWNNHMYVYGGVTEVYQISKVDDCRLSVIGQLSFRMSKGACTNVANEFIFICFPDYADNSTAKKCYKTSQPLGTFQAARDSTHPHKNTRIGNNGGRVQIVDRA